MVKHSSEVTHLLCFPSYTEIMPECEHTEGCDRCDFVQVVLKQFKWILNLSIFDNFELSARGVHLYLCHNGVMVS